MRANRRSAERPEPDARTLGGPLGRFKVFEATKPWSTFVNSFTYQSYHFAENAEAFQTFHPHTTSWT